MLRIRKEQMEALAEASVTAGKLMLKRAFVALNDAPVNLNHLDHKTEELDDFISQCISQAKGFQIGEYRAVLAFIQLNYEHGAEFWVRPENQWARDILASGYFDEARLNDISMEFDRRLMEQLYRS